MPTARVSEVPMKDGKLPKKGGETGSASSVEIVGDDKKKPEDVVSWISLYQGADGLDVVALIIGVIGTSLYCKHRKHIRRLNAELCSAFMHSLHEVLEHSGAGANGVVFPLFSLVFGVVRVHKLYRNRRYIYFLVCMLHGSCFN